ncbi:MAG: phosphatidate cytidylyltransferase [Muribaculaceae bacterium]|nr:phosphatidate cytidylyltransferase [Muribaculaceae bacterium]
MKNLLVRSLSGIIYVALIVFCIWSGSAWFAVLSSVFTLLGIIEFQKITVPGPRTTAAKAAFIVDAAAALLLCNLAAICLSSLLEWWMFYIPAMIIPAYFVCRYTLALYDRSEKALHNAAMSVFSLIYIALPFGILNTLYVFYNAPHIRFLLLMMFIFIWLNDTGAYCAGSLFGKRRLFPRLSPKKSWEGFFGGMAFCIIAAVITAKFFTTGSMLAWIALSIMVCILSTWGDLFESLIKRTYAIKDSGNLIPGHGGILDRIDSLLFVSIGTAIFIMLANNYLL